MIQWGSLGRKPGDGQGKTLSLHADQKYYTKGLFILVDGDSSWPVHHRRSDSDEFDA
jgi:hypothetical protein